ncbi:MAG: hypothetical protein ACRC62_32495 [Microcoleus sp.]
MKSDRAIGKSQISDFVSAIEFDRSRHRMRGTDLRNSSFVPANVGEPTPTRVMTVEPEDGAIAPYLTVKTDGR